MTYTIWFNYGIKNIDVCLKAYSLKVNSIELWAIVKIFFFILGYSSQFFYNEYLLCGQVFKRMAKGLWGSI